MKIKKKTNSFKRYLALVLALGLIFSFPFKSSAKELQPSLEVRLENSKKAPINGLKIKATLIASKTNDSWVLAEGFADSSISISEIEKGCSSDNGKSIYNFIIKNGLPFLTAVSENGLAVFPQMEEGIYLIYPDETGDFRFDPYSVTLPMKMEGGALYTVISAPKIAPPSKKRSIPVLKRWEDNNDFAKKRPKEITVYLERNGETIKTAKLSDENAWTCTFKGLPKKGKYKVKEKSVESYSPNYSGDKENGFIITNVYEGEKLPQTGQLWIPLILIAIVGVCFLMLGIIDLGAKRNGKKK